MTTVPTLHLTTSVSGLRVAAIRMALTRRFAVILYEYITNMVRVYYNIPYLTSLFFMVITAFLLSGINMTATTEMNS